MAQIFHYFNIKSNDQAQIFEAVKTVAGIKSWWTSGTKQIDDCLEFTFNDVGTMRKLFRVTNASPNTLVEWECLEGADEWIGTKVEFKIIPKDDGTTDLSFKHDQWADQTEYFAHCNYHWGMFMKSLKQYIETGVGAPHIF